MAQRYAAQGWLDWAKMEGERGKLQRSGMILRYGLEFCEFSEPLLTRAIKHEERRGASEDTHCSFSAVSRQLLANCLRKCGGGTAEKHHMAAGSYVRNQVQSKEGRSGDHNITATGPKVCQVTSANSPCTSALHKHSTGCVMGSDERDNPGEVQQTEQRDTGIISLSSYCEVSGGVVHLRCPRRELEHCRTLLIKQGQCAAKLITKQLFGSSPMLARNRMA